MSKSIIITTLTVGLLSGLTEGHAKTGAENIAQTMKTFRKLKASPWDPRDKESVPEDLEYEKKSLPEYTEDEE